MKRQLFYMACVIVVILAIFATWHSDWSKLDQPSRINTDRLVMQYCGDQPVTMVLYLDMGNGMVGEVNMLKNRSSIVTYMFGIPIRCDIPNTDSLRLRK